MSIQLEFINFIVPVSTIKDKYPGGWEQCLLDHRALIGGRVWYDDYLFRDGAMGSSDIEILIEKWSELGFNTHEAGDTPTKWLDVCVIDSFSGLTLPCDWIELAEYSASLKGLPEKKIIDRSFFSEEQEKAMKAAKEYLLNH
jgi:hypothetical protein